MKKNNKGFTLAEMLIVVAIIGILIAILFPTFTSQLDKTRRAKNAANVRSKISEIQANALLDGNAASGEVDFGEGIDGYTIPGLDSASHSFSGKHTITCQAGGGCK